MKRHTFLQKQGNIQKDKNRPDEKKGKKELNPTLLHFSQTGALF